MGKLHLLLFSLLVFLSACGIMKFNEKEDETKRVIASSLVQTLLSDELVSFEHEIEIKFKALHSYYILGHKNLKIFDRKINDSNSLKKIYESSAYLSLITIRTQIDDLENEISDIYFELKRDQKKNYARIKTVERIILNLYSQNPITESSVFNLKRKLAIGSSTGVDIDLNEGDLNKHIESLEETKEYQIAEKNIEHLSHLLEIKLTGQSKKFAPNSSDNGNITGNEFPSKVWAITLNDGPQANSTEKYLELLNRFNFKATFFGINRNMISNKSLVMKIKKDKMEIAAHSSNHFPLTKVGSFTVEKEITESVHEIKETFGTDIKLFRLPYGSGVNNTMIREKIAENGLIHVMWNIDPIDWLVQTPQSVSKRAINLMKKTKNDSGIIMLHEQFERSLKASFDIFNYLKQNDRRICTIGEIIQDMNEEREIVCKK